MNWEPQLRRPDYSGGPHKLLSGNRARYIAQSAATEAGKLGELPPAATHDDETEVCYGDVAHIAAD